MAKISFVRPEDAEYIRVADISYPDETQNAAMRNKVPDEERFGQEVRTYYPGGADELQLFEVRCLPNTQFHSHAHDEDEILYVLEGELHIGRRVYPAQSAVYIPGATLYGFSSGPEGLRFLNFRPRADTTYITRDELMAARSGRAAGDS